MWPCCIHFYRWWLHRVWDWVKFLHTFDIGQGHCLQHRWRPDEEDFLDSCTITSSTGEIRWCKAFSMALGNWQHREEKAPIKETLITPQTGWWIRKGRKTHSASHKGVWYISGDNQDTGTGACKGGRTKFSDILECTDMSVLLGYR